ncbi:MAG: hypothetical protein H0U61_05425 [Nocardioidaceae bacterium]|nr:hypothetical protein [Nocardioidaceae bacterium]
MRSYHDVIDVRRGLVAGQEAPEQFLWRDRLWVVRDVLAHWVETGAWWEQAGLAALLGAGVTPDSGTSADGATVGAGLSGGRLGAELLAERDVWRVEAGRGRAGGTAGVFDLAFDWGDAQWRLIGCAD